MQDPNEDTEWNDALRKHGILPARPKTPEIEDPEPVDDKVSFSVKMSFSEEDFWINFSLMNRILLFKF